MAAVQAVEPGEPIEEPVEKVLTGLDSLTAGEMAMAERKAGQSVGTLGNMGYPQVGLLGALGWALAKRSEPSLTYDAYMASRRTEEVYAELGLGGDDEEEDDEGKAEKG